MPIRVILRTAVSDTTLFKRRIFNQEWLVTGALTLVMVGFYGAQLSFGVFLKPLLVEFGWTRALASGAMSTAAMVSGVGGVIMGRLTDKYGARVLIAIGAFAGGFGYLLMSYASSLWQLYLYFGVMAGICIASCWTPVMATVSRWFVEKRVLALSIAISGITVGNMLLPPLSAFFISVSGWRYAYVVLAITVWVTAVPAVILLGRAPHQGSEVLQRGTGKTGKAADKGVPRPQAQGWATAEAVKTVSFWMLMVTGFVIAAGNYFILVHIVAYATDIGIASTSAALTMTFVGGANITGRFLVLPVATRIGNRLTLLFLLVLEALALFLLMGATDLWMFYVLGSVFGLGFGATTPIRTAMIPEFFGLSSVGTMIGVVHIAWEVGAICGPVLAGYVFDLSGNYDMAFLAGGLLMVTGMVATCYLKAPQSNPGTHSHH